MVNLGNGCEIEFLETKIGLFHEIETFKFSAALVTRSKVPFSRNRNLIIFCSFGREIESALFNDRKFFHTLLISLQN